MILQNLNDNSFLLNEIPHSKVYELRLDRENVSIVNIYDSSDILFSNIHYSNITINGVSFGSPLEALMAYEDLKKKDDIIVPITPPKVFRALITKIGTDNPTLTILRNTTGAVVQNLLRTTVGGASITFNLPILIEAKTGIDIVGITSNGGTVHARRVTDTNVFINTKLSGVSSDITLFEHLIHIEIEN